MYIVLTSNKIEKYLSLKNAQNGKMENSAGSV
jgi:hypothetical protein